MYIASPSPSYSRTFLALGQGPSISLFFAFFHFPSDDCWNRERHKMNFLFYLISRGRFGWSVCILKSQRIFHPSVSGWSFTEIWVTASLLSHQDSSQYFCDRHSGWFWFLFWFPIPLVFFSSLRRPFQAHQLELISPSLSYSTAFLIFRQGLNYHYLFAFFDFLLWSVVTAKSTIRKVLFF